MKQARIVENPFKILLNISCKLASRGIFMLEPYRMNI